MVTAMEGGSQEVDHHAVLLAAVSATEAERGPSGGPA